ncbi:MAG TPA: pyridoxamine 5'-phosphate oxidase family protein [Micromonosporaceae bacterium]|jgi:hypothetical protein
MASWSTFAAEAPSLSASISSAIHQFGAGLGFLATVRPDGGPRVHPVAPAIVGGGLFCCLVDSPKRCDLERDPRYAFHAFPSDDSNDEAGLRGRVRTVDDPAAVRRIADAMRAAPHLEWRLYELCIDTAFYVRRGTVFGRQTWVDPRPLAMRYAC